MKLQNLAEMVDGDITGDPELDITGIGKIDSAAPDQISFISNPLYERHFSTTNAGCVIVSREFEPPAVRNDVSLLRVDDPYLSFIRLLEFFEKDSQEDQEGISDLSFVGEDTELGEGVFIDSFVSVGRNCRIGDKTRILSNCSIDSSVTVGDNCLIYPNVTIYKGCIVGNNVVIHSGTVIGSDGFGFAQEKDGSYKKILQAGNVIIEDDVEIGSNTSIDRATIGSTLIRRGVKIDNHVQIAHNVEIGENTAIAAQAGIAGSAKIGRRCKIAGQAGIVGHIEICDDVIIGASVGVSKSITVPGIYTGYRALPSREDLRREIRIRNIQNLEDRIKQLEKTIQTLKERNA